MPNITHWNFNNSINCIFTSRGQCCSLGSMEVMTWASQPHPRPKSAPAVEHKDIQPIWLSLSPCYDLLSFGVTNFTRFVFNFKFLSPNMPHLHTRTQTSSVHSSSYVFILPQHLYSSRLLLLVSLSSILCILAPLALVSMPCLVCTQSYDTGVIT